MASHSLQTNETIRLGKKLGKGGEGVVYELRDNPNFVAKIYYPKKLPPMEKLRLMAANQPENPTKVLNHVSIVWVTGLVHNKQGKIVGCVMPKITWGVPIYNLYNPRERRQHFVGFTWKYLHRTARNLAAAVAAIHAKGYIIGDLNESNILVQPTALVSLVDTDSFQVPNPNGDTFRCLVGKPEYTAPELQGIRLSEIDRTVEHDRFALAVLIFLLLMEGSHPFRGIGDPPEIRNRIRRGLFPYSLISEPPAQPPPLNVPFHALHPNVQHLFHTCFIEGQFSPDRRPSASDWVSTLQQAEAELVQCVRNPHHFYLHTQPECTWCERTRFLHGNDPFPEEAQLLPVIPAQPKQPPAAKEAEPSPVQLTPTTPVTSRTQKQPSTSPKRKKRILYDALTYLIAIALSFLVLGLFKVMSDSTQRSRVSRAKGNMRAIGTALESYWVDFAIYPIFTSEIELSQHIISHEYYGGPYTDAWGTPFRYNSNGNTYRLISFGKDREAGSSGSEFDADIVYENEVFVEPEDLESLNHSTDFKHSD